MFRRVSWFVAVFLFVSTTLAQGVGTDPGLELRLEPVSPDLEIRGATPGATVVIVGVTRDVSGFLPATIRTERVATADHTGRAEATVPFADLDSSVWFAVDLTSGSLAIVVPEGGEGLRIDKPGRGLGETLGFLEDRRRFLQLVVARPSGGPGESHAEAGAWGGQIGDGNVEDRDGAVNGRLTVRLPDLRSITDGPPAPERLAPGDVVIGVDGRNLQFYAQRLASPAAGAAATAGGVDLGDAR